jgi:hypothetical protein
VRTSNPAYPSEVLVYTGNPYCILKGRIDTNSPHHETPWAKTKAALRE